MELQKYSNQANAIQLEQEIFNQDKRETIKFITDSMKELKNIEGKSTNYFQIVDQFKDYYRQNLINLLEKTRSRIRSAATIEVEN
jgi:predicted glycosyl hydrolase (DUF1957 family)